MHLKEFFKYFRWQTKPKMTIHGDLYYEGKEFETRLKEKKPGDLSEELRTALGMPVGPNANKVKLVFKLCPGSFSFLLVRSQ